ncbi:hypothetical protein [Burkholderia anthina]|uniref:hypothetical protein n=1 Tax=Burkholderia anthina TaxID=179879 RepID=UPI00158E3582|nr:hypothetical protein [Burkholderia anthina]
MLIDVGALSCDCTDTVLDVLSKAVSGEDGDGPDIWRPHENPFVRSLIELFSSRGMLRIDKVRDELAAWLGGKRHLPQQGFIPPTPKPAGPWLSDSELSLVRIYLENLPPASFMAEDWSLLVDYLVSRYMPAAAMQTEAEWLTVRSVFMGKVQAVLGSHAADATPELADQIMAALPLTVSAAQEAFAPSRVIQSILEYGRARCADNVQAITEATRHRLKRVIMAHEEQRMLGAEPPKHTLQTTLFDEFATLNRDWRRIALTEVGENAGQGLIASLKPGSRVQRMEVYKGACPFCKKINGMVFTVVDPTAKDKDGVTQVWPGKTNIGRSGAARKRVGSELIPRTAAELWWVPAGTVHPHCRGTWHALADAHPDDDPKFATWLEQHFAKTRGF